VEGLAELAFRRHHAQIYRYLRRRTGDPDRAEDDVTNVEVAFRKWVKQLRAVEDLIP
jgi:DNA-directed RNA polymerase specialized sigma24 family protein